MHQTGGANGKNPLRCNYWVLVGPLEPKMVGFRDLVGSAYGPVSKNAAVKENTLEFKEKSVYKVTKDFPVG